MKKVLALFLSIILTMGIFAGCGKKQEDVKKEDKNVEKTAENNKAKESKKLVVYSPHIADMINPIIKEFQEKTGIQVELVAAGTGELLKRIDAEKDNPQGDVMWGGGAESLNAFKEDFEPYKSKEADMIYPQFMDKDYHWIGTNALPMVIMYNKKLVKPEDVPTSWKDLLDKKWKGKIAYADPTRSGSSFTILGTMLTAYKDTEDNGWKFIKDFVSNLDGKVLSSSSAVPKGVADGEYAVGLTLEYTAMRYVTAGADVAVVYPSEGTSAVPDAAAIIKGAKNIENAKKFMDFILSKNAGDYILENFTKRSVRKDSKSSDKLIPMDKIKLLDYNLQWISANKAKMLKKWKDIIVGKY